MGWDVEYTDEFEAWWDSLDAEEQEAITAAVESLEDRGLALGRPLVDTVRDSQHANMKELRPPAGNLRILFAFDPRRTAILLIGGNKTSQWNWWYRRMIPRADQLYDDHLAVLRKEGSL